MVQSTYFLKYTKFCMMLIGIMKPELSTAYLVYIYRIWEFLIPCCYLLFCISFMIGMRSVPAELLLKNDEMTYLWTFIMIIVKLIFSQTNTMRNVIDEMFKLENGIDKEDVGARKKYLIYSRYNFKIFRVLASIYFGTLCQLLWLMKYSWAKKSLFFTAWFPFDRIKYYTFTFVFQLVTGIFITVYVLTFDTLFTAIIVFPSMLLEILGNKFEHFADCCKKQPLQPKLVLRNLILEHKAIIRYVENLDSSMKWFFFIDFLVKSYHLSVMIISLVTAAEGMNVNFAFAMSKFAYWTLEAWCLYYHGNELMVKSLDITDRIFKSNWFEHDFVVKKMFLIIMLRSKKPLKLRVGAFQILSNDLMVKFFKAGYSVMAWSDKLKD